MEKIKKTNNGLTHLLFPCGGVEDHGLRCDSLFDPSEREPSFVANGFIAGLAKPLNDSVMHVLGGRPVKIF